MPGRKRPRSPARPVNVPARALGSKLFGQKVLTPKKGYRRKVKHGPGRASGKFLPGYGDDDEQGSE